MRVNSVVRLYPAAWRARYGDEMAALLESRRPGRWERLDLIRGALDAWVHPPTPSAAPILAALIGGGLWTVLAVAVVVQPAPPDWPGYLAEIVPLAGAAAACLSVAAIGCLLRAGEAHSRAIAFATGLVLLGYLAWIVMLGATHLGLVGGPPLAAAQTLAMLGTIAVGLILVRGGDQPIGFLVVVAPVGLLLPSTTAWLAFGAAWTAIGIAMWLDRDTRSASPGATA
jgi:hypothetical protein